MPSRVSWPPQNYKPPTGEEKRTSVFLDLLSQVVFKVGTPKEKRDPMYWRKRYQNAKS
jgi:hypothetical protein